MRHLIHRGINGVRWELQPEFAPLLEDLLKSHAQIIKESPVKSVTVHQLGNTKYYVKRYLHHAVSLRPLKFLFKSTQARWEWKLAQELERRGIPIVRHLALGERRTWKGVEESILVTEAFAGLPLVKGKHANASAVLDFVKHMHEQGVVQTDLHPGNLLLQQDPLELRLVDLHGVCVRPVISAEEREHNLALLRGFLPIPVSTDIQELSKKYRRRLYYTRSKRCLRENREFTRRSFGRFSWQSRLEWHAEDARPLLEDPDTFLDKDATILKPGRTSTVGKKNGLVLKRWNFRKITNLVKDLFRPSRARRAFRAAHHLELVGLPTARPLAFTEHRSCGILLRSYLVMEEIPGATDLGQHLRNVAKVEPALLTRIALLVAKMHEAGFSHRDLKETNLVFDVEDQLYLLDLDGLSFLNRLSSRRAASDLARLARAVSKFPSVTRQDRCRFLLSYCRARRLRRVPRTT